MYHNDNLLDFFRAFLKLYLNLNLYRRQIQIMVEQLLTHHGGTMMI